MQNFSDHFLNSFKIRRNNIKTSRWLHEIGHILNEYLANNFDSVQEKFIKYCFEQDIDEKDLNFAIDLVNIKELSHFKKKFLNKIFDIALEKNKFSYSTEYKDLLKKHFSEREKYVFMLYLKKALNNSDPLKLNVDDAKYLAKKIVRSKIDLDKNQTNYLLSLLNKVNIKNEYQYFVYFSLLNYLAKFSNTALSIFEKKFNELYLINNGMFYYGFAEPQTVAKILLTCSDKDLRYKLAKIFLLDPYKNNLRIKKVLMKRIPELSKLFNLD